MDNAIISWRRLVTTLFCLVSGLGWVTPATAQDTTKKSGAAAAGAHYVPHISPGAVAAMQVQAKQLDPSTISVLLGQTAQAAVVRRANSSQPVPLSPGATTLASGDQISTRVAARAERVRATPGFGVADSVWKLPLRVLALSATGETQLLYVLTFPRPLSYEANSSAFSGTVSFLVIDSLHPTDASPLTTPLAIFTELPEGTTAPANFTLDHLNLPPASVSVSTSVFRDSVPLHVSTKLDPQGYDLRLPLASPIPIKVERAPEAILGFGLEAAVVYVTLPREAGSAAMDVRVLADRAEPEPSLLHLAGGETGKTSIRSTGVGDDLIHATAGPFTATPTPIHYSWPLLFVAAALLGGVVATAILAARARSRGKGASRSRHMLSGLASGFFVAVAYAVGVNFTGVNIPARGGEAVVFVVAALGTLIGLPGLAKAIPALGEALAGESKG